MTTTLRFGLIVAVDIEGFSVLDTREQADVQARLDLVLRSAARRAGLARDTWERQPRGDGELAIVPLTVDPSRVIAEFTDRIADALAHPHPVQKRPLRLRVAMHIGSFVRGELGPVGDAPIVACRLLDAPAVRQTLSAERGVDLVLVVSERLYSDVVCTRLRDLAPDRFRPIRVVAKGSTFHGRVCVGSPRERRSRGERNSSHLKMGVPTIRT